MQGTGIRLPEATLSDLDEIARELCNTRSGLIRLATEQLISAHRERKARRATEPELPLSTADDDEYGERAAEEPT